MRHIFSIWLLEIVYHSYFFLLAALFMLALFVPIFLKGRAIYFPLGFWEKKVRLRKPILLLMPLLVVSTALLFAFIISGPETSKQKIASREYNQPVLLVMDVSGSMSSLYEMQLKAFNKITRTNQQASFGLIIYSDYAYVARDFAPDISLLADTIENETEISTISGGTNTTQALALARSLFAKEGVGSGPKSIVLISDLDDDLERVSRQMNFSLADDINIFIVGIGDNEYYTQQQFSRLQRMLAREVFFAPAQNESAMSYLLKELQNRGEGFMVASREKEKDYSGGAFLPPLIALFLLSLFFSATTLRKIN